MLYKTKTDEEGNLIVVDLFTNRRVPADEEVMVLAQKELLESSQQSMSNPSDDNQEQTESSNKLEV
ncbi:MAG TPA: hypothetical protein DHS36_04020 [Candidatus Veblenbacteria bacterium]|uniref:Uncharacterized protein n=2 Tax=Candidatus Vebleniibacteriota TaxID=1817921 RepID=A0A1G2Q315_9BACT|nr:MAG: hypothetical protein A2388_02645 [Candidatus Veblenbacteria bacterium RIFOXYB1_FULL_43_13]OHA54954.1 MAG: hypothetical protein A2226_03055 [Candidatus Veblenbacteria bacterium RIFOXYA2_FULL_43_9]HCX39394.1 hypothetical protein [Candidatus Veblenbacteria bacterium]